MPLISPCAFSVFFLPVSQVSAHRLLLSLDVPYLVERKREGEGASIARVAGGPDCAAVIFDDLPGDGEAQTRAFIVRGKDIA